MFSGFGVYAEDVCFAVFLRGEVFLKADPSSVARFEAEGSTPFSYSQTKSGKVINVNSWWRLPARLYDEPDELAEWTRAAVAVAHALKARKKSAKPKSSQKNPPGPHLPSGNSTGRSAEPRPCALTRIGLCERMRPVAGAGKSWRRVGLWGPAPGSCACC
ncbi:MAG: TfoX/Sxy family protein [Pseudolabrys sp.]|nr:TfoX/Sxy family protein [Pseudolabrys sp.]